jgi:RluA family pseudouridine synthase
MPGMAAAIAVVWSDDTLLVVDKPAGLPVLPDGYDPQAPFVVGLLKQKYGVLWVVHRLDRGTSGVLALARTADAHRALNRQFDERRVRKEYRALVCGVPGWDERVIDLPLRADGDRRHRTVVDERGGKPALTRVAVLERFAGYALVAAFPATGRTHQIRAHLAVAGYPLVGDELYAGWHAVGSRGDAPMPREPGAPPLARLALHARVLELEHPATGEALHFEAAYPEDFEEALGRLRYHRGAESTEEHGDF